MYSNEEYADMHLAYGQANQVANIARRLYSERFPNRNLPNSRTFSTADRLLRETG